MEKYVQAGQIALRSPRGEFLPAVPLFVREREAGIKSPSSGRTVAEEVIAVSDDVKRLFADKFRQYHDGIDTLEAGKGYGGEN